MLKLRLMLRLKDKDKDKGKDLCPPSADHHHASPQNLSKFLTLDSPLMV
jgi:hypothetical protein